jgi:CDP-diacylglycerol--serine O-phosphatidyltransferase
MPINVAASAITTLALYCGVASIFASIRGEYATASYFILAAIVCDTMDGAVARMTKSVSDFGKELDSLSDVISFGAAPSVLIYTAFLMEDQSIGPMGSMLAVIYVIFGALRLARYNVFQADQPAYFTGLPIPGAAGTIASFTIFCQYFELKVAIWVLAPLTLALSFLMVSAIRYPKKNLQVFTLAPRKGFRFLLGVVIGIAIINFAMEYSPAIVLFPLGMAYVLFGLSNEIFAFVTRKRPINDQEKEQDKEADQSLASQN